MIVKTNLLIMLMSNPNMSIPMVKICLHFSDCWTSFYANRLNREFMKKITSEIIVVFTFQKNIK